MVDTKRKIQSDENGENVPPAKKPRPTCFTCASSNRDCSYTLNPKRRGIHRGYIRTLELTLAWAVGNVPNCDVALKGLLQDEKGQAMLSGLDTAAVEKMHRRWRKTPVCKTIDRILSGSTDGPVEEPEAFPPEEDDDEGEYGEQIVTYNPEASLMTPESQSIDYPHKKGTDSLRRTTPAQPHSAEVLSSGTDEQSATMLVLPDNFWRLLDIYFAYTHSWLPIVEKDRILKICYTYPPEGLAIDSSSVGSGNHAELWNIFALATIQDVPGTRAPTTEPSKRMSESQMRTIARSLRPNDLYTFELGHINSLLLDTLIDLGSRKFTSAWVTLGLATRAISLQESNKKSPAANKIKATFLACFVLETFLAVELMKMPSLRRDQAMQVGFLDEEGMDEWQPWAGCEGFGNKAIDAGAKRSHSPMLAKSTFNQLVKLCYGINNHAVGQICNSSSHEEQYLYEWIQEFPKSLGPLHSLQANESTPQRLNLFLAYLFTRAVCSPQSHSNAVDEALGVLDHYSSTLGHQTMPSIFHMLLDTFQKCPGLDGLRQTRLAGIRSRLSKIWEPRTVVENIFTPPPVPNQFGAPQQSPLTSEPAYRRRSESQDVHKQHEILPHPLPSSLQQPRPPFDPAPTTNPFTHETPPHHRVPDFPPLRSNQAMYSSPYDSFNSQQYNPNAPSLSGGPHSASLAGFTDLDAMFDDLTTFDGVDAGLQPKFMQNLGFAPNADLAEFMGFDVP
ncbi:quinic acid utilization activator [Venturia nashicola]|nr:quinic acid utilization activator [Venturia nashicola]